MTPEYNFIRDKNYLHVSVTGKYSLRGIIEILQNIKKQCAVNSIHSVLFDFSRVDGLIPFTDKYKIGEFVADNFSGKIRMAVVDKTENIDKLGENVAVNRGGRVSVFSNTDVALEWLLMNK
jgi:hypothetical protein